MFGIQGGSLLLKLVAEIGSNYSGNFLLVVGLTLCQVGGLELVSIMVTLPLVSRIVRTSGPRQISPSNFEVALILKHIKTHKNKPKLIFFLKVYHHNIKNVSNTIFKTTYIAI